MTKKDTSILKDEIKKARKRTVAKKECGVMVRTMEGTKEEKAEALIECFEEADRQHS